MIRLYGKVGGKKKRGECGREKKMPTFSNSEKVGILKEKKSGREVGILRKSHFFPKNGHAHTQKTEYGRKIKHFLKWALKKKEKGGRKVDARTLSKSGDPKKKRWAFYVFLKKKNLPTFPYSPAMIEL